MTGTTVRQGRGSILRFNALELRFAHATLGDAAVAAQKGASDADVRRTFLLFGDPAMKLR